MANEPVPLRYYLNLNLFNFIELPEGFMDKIGISDSSINKVEKILEKKKETYYDEEESAEITVALVEQERNVIITLNITASEELPIRIPGLDRIELVIVSNKDSSPFSLTLTLKDDGSFEFSAKIKFKLRFDSDILKPMIKKTGNNGKTLFIEDINSEKIEIEVGEVEVSLDSKGFHFKPIAEFEIKNPFMIGDSGIIIDELNGVTFNLTGNGSKPNNASEDWKGIYIGSAKVYIPDVIPGFIEAEQVGIGSGGFYGKIGYESPITYDEGSKTFSGDDGNLIGEVMGMKGGISSIALEFVQNIPVEADLKGKILLPFFDEPVDVSIGMDIDGNFYIKLADTDEDGIYVFRKEGIVEAKIENISFEKKEDLLIANLSGSIRPLVKIDNIKWPEFKVEKLSIDSNGNVHIDGGWIDLPEKISFDFYGFRMEASRISFGSDEDKKNGKYKWIGLSGRIYIIKELKTEASVEGLRIKWWDSGETEVELQGVGVDFEIPDVLKFDGKVAFDGTEEIFKGDVSLNLMTIGLKVDAVLVADGDNSFYIYFNAELPSGIPLGCSGIGIYGFAGLFGYHMEPNKINTERWYDWYKKPNEGVTSIDKWSTNQLDSLALGGGVSLGTIVDNGYMVSAKTVLVIVIPGPIIFIEGRASFLERRATLTKGEEGAFKALAVIDNRAGQFLMNIEATYKLDKTHGWVIDIHGGAEVFFDYHNINKWHLYLGEKEPREKRISAEVLSLFGAETYFMLKSTGVAWGFWCGFDERWKFGPVKIIAAAWIEGGVDVSWKPAQFWGKVWVYGELGVKVFWFGFGFGLEAGVEVNTPNPFYIYALLRVIIDLPCPLPDFDIEIPLKWKKEKEPPWPLPLKEVAIGHDIIQENIPLPRSNSLLLPNYLLPNYDPDNDEFIDNANQDLTKKPDSEPKNILVVPLDARPILTFGKPMCDTAKVGVNARPELEYTWQKIGHSGDDESVRDYTYKFELEKISLEKRQEENWVPMKKSIYGMWEPVVDGEGRPTQTKLRLWTKTVFSYTRYSTRDYEDEFIENNPNYPCIPPYKPKKICVNFDDLPSGTFYKKLIHHGIEFIAYEGSNVLNISECAMRMNCKCSNYTTHKNALKIKNKKNSLPFILIFPELVSSLRISFYVCYYPNNYAQVVFLDKDWNKVVQFVFKPGYHKITYPKDLNIENGKEIKYIVIKNESTETIKVKDSRSGREDFKIIPVFRAFEVCLFEICYIPLSEYEKEKIYQEYKEHIQKEVLVHWEDEGEILEPYTEYRLKILTKVQRNGGDEKPKEICEYAYFQTEGPPGLVKLPEVQVQNGITQEHPLNSLKLYVKETMPKNGQNPFYRTYDIGVEFKKDYVELMYKIAKHDLRIYLFDNNRLPVKDILGRIITLSNAWGKAEKTILPEEYEKYGELLGKSPCISFDKDSIPSNDILTDIAKERFLLPQKLYEARIIPALLHETFVQNIEDYESVKVIVEDGTKFIPINDLESFKNHIVDCKEPNGADKSEWYLVEETIKDKSVWYLKQSSNIYQPPNTSDNLSCLGTYFIMGNENWSDYRVTVSLSSGDDDAIGVMFRYKSENKYYRFSMDRQRMYRRLVKIKDGSIKLLAEDKWIYERKRIYKVTAEIISNFIKIFLDGELVFEVEDKEEPISNGKIALYCWGNTDARFYEVMVEDLSKNLKSVYNFQFTTSNYANFFHHIHSFNDMILKPIPLSDIVDEKKFQSKEYEGMWTKFIPKPENVELTVVKNDDTPIGFLLKSPEPIEWQRVDIEVRRKDGFIDLGLPGIVKLINYSSSEEWVEFLIREDTSLDGWSIEYATSLENPEWKEFYRFKGLEIFRDDFKKDEEFKNKWIDSKNDLENWKVMEEKLIYIGADKESYITAGDFNWENYRIIGDLHLKGKAEAGLIFRYQNEDNYYKLTLNNNGLLSLKKKTPGEEKTLCETALEETIAKILVWLLFGVDYVSEDGIRCRIMVQVSGDNIDVYVNGKHLFNIKDDKNPIHQGCIGLSSYIESNTDDTMLEFNSIFVTSLEKKILPSGKVIRVFNSKEKKSLIDKKYLAFKIEMPVIDLFNVEQKKRVLIRILDDKGIVIHQRAFSEEGGFTDISLKNLITNPDTTASLISAENIKDGYYKIKFTFNRVEVGLPILKQCDSIESEEVTIEFNL